MRRATLLGLLASCSTPPAEAAFAVPDLGAAFEPASSFLTPLSDGERDAPRLLRVTIEKATRPASAIPLDTLLTTVLADRGAPFRAGSTLLRGWSLLTGGSAPAAGEPAAASEPEAASIETIAATHFVTRLTATTGELPDL
ncbi:MAG: hypothetical protein KDC98_08495, partial [Planctomycetes bacterium]|nr:hypothetical protein [Planctomycetota bacterium]